MSSELIPIPASGTYSADEDIDNAYGSDNVASWAALNPDATTDDIDARKAWARGVAKRWIDSKLRGTGLVAPATADNFSEFALLADVEAERAGAILYQSRGMYDQQQQPEGMDGAMQGHFKHAEAELDRLIDVVQVNATEVSGGIDGISVIGPATNGACCGAMGWGVIG